MALLRAVLSSISRREGVELKIRVTEDYTYADYKGLYFRFSIEEGYVLKVTVFNYYGPIKDEISYVVSTNDELYKRMLEELYVYKFL